jgi:hypothetical protein
MGSVIRLERPVASLAVIKKLVDLGVKRDLWMLTTRRNCTASNHLISAHTLKNNDGWTYALARLPNVS